MKSVAGVDEENAQAAREKLVRSKTCQYALASHRTPDLNLNLQPDWRKVRRIMKVLFFPRVLLFFCTLLLITPVSASAPRTVLFQNGKTTMNMASTRLALLLAWGGPDKQEVAIEKDKNAPQENIMSVPDSYLGAVVVTMFLAGAVLMMVKLQRRKPRRNMHSYFPRSRYGRSSRGSHARRRAA
jgi:hypothetical protein